MSEWYYARNKQKFGPVPRREIQTLLDGGQLGPNDLVWTEGMTNWQKVSSAFGEQRPETRSPPRFAETVPYPTRQREEGLNPFEAPENDMEPVYADDRPRRRRVEYAGFWIRFCASLLDGFIYLFVFIGACIVIGTVGASLRVAGLHEETVALLMGLPALLLIFCGPWLYHALQESSQARATMGKRALGIEVVGMRGEQITFGQATGRFFGKILSGMILYIGFIMAGFTERKQALHDILAGTLVIRR